MCSVMTKQSRFNLCNFKTVYIKTKLFGLATTSIYFFTSQFLPQANGPNLSRYAPFTLCNLTTVAYLISPAFLVAQPCRFV